MESHSRAAIEVLNELRDVVYDDADVRVRKLIDEAIQALHEQERKEEEAVCDHERERFRRSAMTLVASVINRLPWIVALLERLGD